VLRGRLLDPSAAPADGEAVEPLVRVRNLAVEQILSGRVETPVDYRQDQDEWFVVLAGSAVLVVEGERLELAPGDWVLLESGIPHRLEQTEPGTSWLTVHLW
jgi:mannose-6-phosphate isomerase-like protein (cupin superfamily)